MKRKGKLGMDMEKEERDATERKAKNEDGEGRKSEKREMERIRKAGKKEEKWK